MKRTVLILLTYLFFICPSTLYGQRDWDAIEIKTTNITDNISYLEGSGGNIGVLHGPEGVMIVDDQFAELRTFPRHRHQLVLCSCGHRWQQSRQPP